jgi:hypothetical protein
MKINKTNRHARRTNRRTKRRSKHVGGTILTKRPKGMNMTITGDFEKPTRIKGDANIVFDSGETYAGPCNYNLNPHGRGTMTFPDGTVYVGDFNDGNKSGRGKIEYADGSVYDGEFSEDAPHGHGTYTTTRGVYDGQIYYGHKVGRGKMTFANGDVYDGIFKNDKIGGQGVLTKHDGTVVQGNFRGKKDGLVLLSEPEDVMPPMEVNPVFNPAQAAALHAQASADVKTHNLAVKRAEVAARVDAAREKQKIQRGALAAIFSGNYDDAPPSVIAARLGFGK